MKMTNAAKINDGQRLPFSQQWEGFYVFVHTDHRIMCMVVGWALFPGWAPEEV